MWSRRSAIQRCRSSATAKFYKSGNVRFCFIDDRSMLYKAKLSSSVGMTSLDRRSTTPHVLHIVCMVTERVSTYKLYLTHLF